MSEWLESLPEALRNAPFIGKSENAADAIAKLAHAAQLVGTSVRIPGADADDDTRNAFYEKVKGIDGIVRMPTLDDENGINDLLTKLGKPAEYTEYKLPELADFVWDEKMGQSMREYALEAGMTTAQFTKFASKIAEQEKLADANGVTENENQKKALRLDWGDTLEERENLIRGWMDLSNAPPALVELLDNRDLPLETMNWLHSVAKEFKGEVAPISKDGVPPSQQMTPADAREQAQQVMSDLFKMTPTDPRYKDLQMKLVGLNRVATRASAA